MGVMLQSYWKDKFHKKRSLGRKGFWIPTLIYWGTAVFIATALVFVLQTFLNRDYRRILDKFFDNPNMTVILVSLFLSVILLVLAAELLAATAAASVRRLHDGKKSGRWLCVLLIPGIGFIWYIFLMCGKSVKDEQEVSEAPEAAVPRRTDEIAAGEEQTEIPEERLQLRQAEALMESMTKEEQAEPPVQEKAEQRIEVQPRPTEAKLQEKEEQQAAVQPVKEAPKQREAPPFQFEDYLGEAPQPAQERYDFVPPWTEPENVKVLEEFDFEHIEREFRHANK